MCSTVIGQHRVNENPDDIAVIGIFCSRDFHLPGLMLAFVALCPPLFNTSNFIRLFESVLHEELSN